MSRVIKQCCFMGLACALLFAGASQAAQGNKNNNNKKKAGPDETIEFIIEHTVELKLTSDQLSKLNLLQQTQQRVLADPAVEAIMKKIRQAKKNGNEQEFNSLKEHLADKIKERTNGQYGSFKAALGLVLSPDQLKQFHELHDAASGDKDPSTSKDAPPPVKGINPFEL